MILELLNGIVYWNEEEKIITCKTPREKEIKKEIGGLLVWDRGGCIREETSVRRRGNSA